MSTIGADAHDEPDSELEVARAEVARAEAEMKLAEARLRLARADASSRTPATGPTRTEATDDGADDDLEPSAGGDDLAEQVDEPTSQVDETAERDEDHEDDDSATPGDEAAPFASRRILLISAVTFVVVVVLAVVVGRLAQRSDEDDSATPTAALGPDVALRVDDLEVTEDQLAQRVQVLKVLYGLEVPTAEDELEVFRRETARSLASSIVIDQAARDQGLAVSVDDVDSTLARYVQSRYTGDQQAAFSQELAENGITEEDVRDEISRQLNGQQLFVQVTAGITVTDAQARAAYEADPASWALPEQRQLRYIAVPDRATADRVVTALRRGGDFAEIARRRSADASTRENGGSLGLVTADQLDPSFATKAFRAARGNLFGPVETSQGWYVGQVQRIVPARSDYAALRSSIVEGLSSEQALEVWNDYVAQATARATITYSASYQPDAEDSPSAEVPGTAPAPDPSSPPTTTPAAGE